MALTVKHAYQSATPTDGSEIGATQWNADHTITGTLDLTTQVTGTLPVGNGGTGVTSWSAGVDYGFANVPQNSKSADYTLVLGDAGKHVFHPASDANARTFTIPANGSVAYPVGTTITFVNRSASNVTIAITTDTLTWGPSGGTGSRTLAQYGSATALKIGTTEWLITGSGLT
jgi:hypothetical protein